MPAATVDILIREKGAAAVKQQVSGISSSFKGLGGIVSNIAAPIAGMFTIGAIVAYTKKAIEFDKVLTQVAIQAHVNVAGQAKVKQSMLDTAQATGVAKEDLLQYLKSVTDATGNFTVATDSMLWAAKAAQATGADLQGLGNIASDAALKFGLTGEAIGEGLSVMIAQGEMGRLTLEEMARVAPKAMSVAGLAGMKGMSGLRDMGAYLQMIRQGYGSAEEAATGFRRIVSEISSPANAKKLKALGVSTRDPKTKKLREFGDVFLDVIQKAGGQSDKLLDIFGTEGILGVTEFNRIFKESGFSIDAVTAELDKYRNVVGGTSALQEKFGRAEETASVKIDKAMQTLKKSFEDVILTPGVVDTVAESFTNLAISAVALAETLGFAKEWWEEKTGPVKGKERAVTGGVVAAMMAGSVLGPVGAIGAGYLAYRGKMALGQGSWGGTGGRVDMSNAANIEASQIASDVFSAPQSFNAPGGMAGEEMLDAIAENFSKPQEFTVNVNVLNADGATVDVQSTGNGKLKPTGGASQ